MAGLFSLVGSTATALNAQSEAITVTGNNIANVSNPNYSEETVDFQPMATIATADGPQSMGLSVDVTQQRSAILDQMVRQEDSLASSFNTQQGLLGQAQAALDESVTNSSTSGSSTTSENGLSAAINSFFNAFQSVAASPSDPDQVSSLMAQASVLTDRFQQVDQNLAQVQTNASAQVSGDVTTANNLLQQIGQLNSQIQSLEVNAPGSAVQLRDQREGDLEQLAGIIPITVTEGSNGEDQVSTAGTGGSSVTLVNLAQATPLSFSGGVISAGSPPVALDPASGSLQGALAAATGPVQDLRTGLDQLAAQIVSAVNSAYNPGGTTGGNFFDASGTTAGTIALDPSLSESSFQAGTSPGDNSLAVAVADVANQTFSTASGGTINGTITQAYAGTVANIGEAVSTVTAQAQDQSNVQTIVNNQRSAESGVSVDQEMSNLVIFQRAYQASSEVFQVVDDLLGGLINTIGMSGG
jgi:flagellar hook-associated protein 1 FlgK